MCVNNPDCLPFAIYRRDTAPTPSGFAEIISDDFPVFHATVSLPSNSVVSYEGLLLMPHCLAGNRGKRIFGMKSPRKCTVIVSFFIYLLAVVVPYLGVIRIGWLPIEIVLWTPLVPLSGFLPAAWFTARYYRDNKA